MSMNLFCGVEVRDTNLMILAFDPDKEEAKAKCLMRRSSKHPSYVFLVQDVSKASLKKYLLACGIPECKIKQMIAKFALVLMEAATCESPK